MFSGRLEDADGSMLRVNAIEAVLVTQIHVLETMTPSAASMRVSVPPGHTAFTRTPYGAASSATERVSPSTACLLAV